MKLLPESKKKTIIFLILFFLFTGATVYMLVSSRGAGAPVPPPNNSSAAQNGTDSSVNLGSEDLLPYGATINTSILKEPRFQNLHPTTPLTITPGELGNPNLFGQ